MQSIKNILINFYNLLALLVLVVLLPSALLSQPVVQIGNITGCQNTEILVPVQITNMENIAALTLYIKVDTNVVDYVGLEDVNDAFSSGEFVGNKDDNNQEIILTWFSTTATSLESGVMCKIRVLFKNGSTSFDFLDKSEFAHPDLTVVQGVEYINGTLKGLSLFTPEPASQSIKEGNEATIELPGLVVYGDEVSIQWQLKEEDVWSDLTDDDTYNGVNTVKLTIHSVLKEMNGNLYRCFLSNGICSVETGESELLVTPDGIDEDGFTSGLMTVYPNPAHTTINCLFGNEILKGEIRLVDIKGTTVEKQTLRNVAVGEVLSLNLDDVDAGVYFLKLYNNNQFVSVVRVIKN